MEIVEIDNVTKQENKIDEFEKLEKQEDKLLEMKNKLLNQKDELESEIFEIRKKKFEVERDIYHLDSQIIKDKYEITTRKIIDRVQTKMREESELYDFFLHYDELVAMFKDGSTDDENEDGRLYQYDEDEYNKLWDKLKTVTEMKPEIQKNIDGMFESIEYINNIIENIDTYEDDGND